MRWADIEAFKPPRRYGRSEAISLLSPAHLFYPLELWPFHTGNHYRITKAVFDLCSCCCTRSQAEALYLYTQRAIANRSELTYLAPLSLLFLEETAPVKLTA